MQQPFPPELQKDVTTTRYSVNISWVIPSIIFDQESYTVQYGNDLTMLLYTSEIVQGDNDTNILDGMFSVSITELTPFTTYYYTVNATNSIGSTNSDVMSFRTDQAGMCADCILTPISSVYSSQYSSYGLHIYC